MTIYSKCIATRFPISRPQTSLLLMVSGSLFKVTTLAPFTQKSHLFMKKAMKKKTEK